MATVTACSTLGYCNFPVDVAIERIADLGFKKIEFAHLGVYCLHYRPGLENPIRLRRLLQERSLQPVAMNYSTCWADNGRKISPNLADPEHAEIVVENVRTLLVDLASIGVPLLNISVGRRQEDLLECRRRMEASAKVVNALAKFANDLGIRLTLEVPHCFDLYHNLDRVAEMFSLIDSDNVGALLDSSHWTVLKYDLEQWWSIVGNRLWHVHLRDARGPDTADFNQELELTPGEGECDFAELGKWLDQHSFCGEVSLESEYRQPTITLDEISANYDFAFDSLRRSNWRLPTTARSAERR